MIMLGQMQTLTVCRSTENGVYLESKADATPTYSEDTAAIAEKAGAIVRNEYKQDFQQKVHD